MVSTSLRRACAVAFCMLLATEIEAAEKLVSTNLDTRTVLAFRVPDEVVQKLLPAGWELDAAPNEPNFRIIFANNLLVQDAEGKASENIRIVTLAAQARKTGTDEKAGMALGGFVSSAAAVPGPYFNYSYASAAFSQRIAVDGSGKSVIEEAWEFTGDGGTRLNSEFNSYEARLRASKRTRRIIRLQGRISSGSTVLSRRLTRSTCQARGIESCG